MHSLESAMANLNPNDGDRTHKEPKVLRKWQKTQKKTPCFFAFFAISEKAHT